MPAIRVEQIGKEFKTVVLEGPVTPLVSLRSKKPIGVLQMLIQSSEARDQVMLNKMLSEFPRTVLTDLYLEMAASVGLESDLYLQCGSPMKPFRMTGDPQKACKWRPMYQIVIKLPNKMHFPHLTSIPS